MSSPRRFQINLRGIIDLLSHHLYSGPEVYLRELLQNATDALSARAQLEKGFIGRVELEWIASREPGGPATLVVTDNGIGLTAQDIETFLSTIGLSSKRDELDRQRSEFLGQFGIGLLSCFMVSDEIVMVTRSCKSDQPAYKWTGRPDGTYSVEPVKGDLTAGTRVYLRQRQAPEIEAVFSAAAISELARKYGQMLPYSIDFKTGAHTERINPTVPPWRRKYADAAQQRRAFLDFGRELTGLDFIDAFPLRAPAGQAEGIAWVLPFTPDLASRGVHRVYLKGMLLSEAADNLLPDWAFFIQSVIDARNLRPTASREGFYEDDILAQTREQLGTGLRDYCCRLAREEPGRLKELIGLHHLSIKALAAEDEEFCALFLDWLPFETNLGTLTLPEIVQRSGKLTYAANHDQFRQVAQVATAQGLCVADAGYVYDDVLLRNYARLHPDTTVEPLSPNQLLDQFENLTSEEQEATAEFLSVADATLRPLRCHADIRRFQPTDLPALYSLSRDAAFWRSVQQSKQVSNALWSSVLDGLAPQRAQHTEFADLCFNLSNPLVERLTKVADRELLARCVQMLYLQALLQGHQPMKSDEIRLLNLGMLDLIQWSLTGRGEVSGGGTAP